jgi:ankyrin repeat domain-containing protein 50
MGDGFGVGAGIVGVVSLGLTVCQGLIKFYNSARSQQADVANAVRQLESVRSTLTVLEGVTKKTPPDSYGNVLNVESKIKLCGEGINSLSAYLKKCEPERKQKIFYPFRRESLRELGQTLQSLQQNLSTALGAFTVYAYNIDRQ